MNTEKIAAQLRTLQAKHNKDFDGGYALVAAIKDWVHSLSSLDQVSALDALLTLVEEQEPTFWGVALEAMVQEHPHGIAAKISNFVTLPGRSQEWKDQITLALIRLKYGDMLPYYINYISEALTEERKSILPLLAAISGVDGETYLELSSKYFGRVLASPETAEKVRGCIPAFVRNALENNEDLLPQLIVRTKHNNASSSARLAVLISDYLAQPFLARDFGSAKLAMLRRIIHNSAPAPILNKG